MADFISNTAKLTTIRSSAVLTVASNSGQGRTHGRLYCKVCHECGAVRSVGSPSSILRIERLDLGATVFYTAVLSNVSRDCPAEPLALIARDIDALILSR